MRYVTTLSASVHCQIPRAVLYLPLTALLALAVLLAALGDQTTLHFILPNEVIAPPTLHSSSDTSARHVIALRSTDISGDLDDVNTDHRNAAAEAAVTFQTIEVCKRLDQIPAIVGFVYLIALLLVSVFMLATAKHTKNNPYDFKEVSSLYLLLMLPSCEV